MNWIGGELGEASNPKQLVCYRNGPSGLQVAVAVVTPLVLSSFAARRVGLPWSGVARWATRSLVALGAVLVLWLLLVAATVGSGL